jgi:hypothetical protein
VGAGRTSDPPILQRLPPRRRREPPLDTVYISEFAANVTQRSVYFASGSVDQKQKQNLAWTPRLSDRKSSVATI